MRTGDFEHWRRATFRVAMNDVAVLGNGTPHDGFVEVDGIVMSPLHDVQGEGHAEPELGLHVGLTHMVDCTHLASGKRIGSFETLGAAMEFVNRLAYVANWRNPAERITAGEAKALSDLYANVTASACRPRRVV